MTTQDRKKGSELIGLAGLPSSQSMTEDSYKITEIDIGGNRTLISIIVNADDSLRILDYSYGRLADEMYGEGRDVEHWLDLDADSIQQLMSAMTGEATPDAAHGLAKLLAKNYAGQNLALRSIKELCDGKGIDYKEEFWPW